MLPVHPGFDPRLSIGAPPSNGGRSPYFAGYPAGISATHGDPLDVHVATRQERSCHVDVYRVLGCLDAGFEPALEFVTRAPERIDPLRYAARANNAPLVTGACDSFGCRWPARRALAHLPPDWPSGLYLIQFTAEEEPTGRISDALGQDALVVVRPSRPRCSRLLQVGISTWSAYHLWGPRNLYGGLTSEGIWSHQQRAHRVSFERPGVGLGTFNQSTWGPGKGAYLFKFIEWARTEGLSFDFCTGIDLDAGRIDLHSYRLLVTVGHDEYWTGPQRDAVESFVAGGGNAAFFGGNLSYWQVRAADGGSAVECHKRAGDPFAGVGVSGEPLDPLYRDPERHPEHDNSHITVQFLSEPVNRSTTSLTGVSMRNDEERRRNGEREDELVFAGAAWWWEDLGGPQRPAKGFTVLEPDHWALEGTGLRARDVFGERQRVVGFECDGLDVEPVDWRVRPTGRDGALPGTQIIAFADCRDWAELDHSFRPAVQVRSMRANDGALGGVVTLVSRRNERGGETFTAPTTDWVFALVPTIDYTAYRAVHPPVNPASPQVQRITQNVLRRLG